MEPQSCVLSHNRFMLIKPLSELFPRSRAFRLNCTLMNGSVLGSFEKLSASLKEAHGVVAIVVGKQRWRKGFENTHVEVEESFVGQSHKLFHYSEGFALTLPEATADLAPADLFWYLVLSEGAVTNVVTWFDISELVGIESGF